jgi:hypothetical protein
MDFGYGFGWLRLFLGRRLWRNCLEGTLQEETLLTFGPAELVGVRKTRIIVPELIHDVSDSGCHLLFSFLYVLAWILFWSVFSAWSSVREGDRLW